MYIIWKWHCAAPDSGSEIESPKEDTQYSTEDNGSDPEDAAASVPHALVFKCIGSTKSQQYQNALNIARDLLADNQAVPVTLFHEKNNPRDPRALAFVCEINGKSRTVGYVVSELLEEVHAAISDDIIISVKFSWIRYITDWTKSGPGFFAGVEIKKKGPWSPNAIKSASTR